MNSFVTRNKWIAIVILVLITDFSIQAPVYADKLYPIDQGTTDPSFKTFREELRAAIKSRDSKFILNSLAPDVLVSYGGCEGVKCFIQFWKLNQPNSKIWDTLSNVLSLGGSFETYKGEKYFCAPYVFSEFPDRVNGEELMGVHEYAAIIGQNVNVRLRPSLNAPIVTSLSYDIIKLDQSPNHSSGNWFKILAPTPGYVSSQFIRNPFDYRACFKKVRETPPYNDGASSDFVNGKWLMNALVAGD
jgi:hypothetical protein